MQRSSTLAGTSAPEIDPVDGELTARFDGRAVTHAFGELDMLAPAYAAEPRVGIPGRGHPGSPTLQRNLLYAGVTRGKKLVVLVGQKSWLPSLSATSLAADVVKTEGMAPPLPLLHKR